MGGDDGRAGPIVSRFTVLHAGCDIKRASDALPFCAKASMGRRRSRQVLRERRIPFLTAAADGDERAGRERYVF
ncbi:unnamed protein product [Mycetohabitans rhizoxinica HKI 454]|uniref:Uncharacterized protein n=1 Tax=Mycetohabitans rhizoxinica (strain DSM 19002 / CIP 109453 / HKI 454) TaxID=882378 RepID=E5AKU6_MYCRK|nr:unnamed protein product [Mycetohabitans rhizoxinica HKI 454]